MCTEILACAGDRLANLLIDITATVDDPQASADLHAATAVLAVTLADLATWPDASAKAVEKINTVVERLDRYRDEQIAGGRIRIQ